MTTSITWTPTQWGTGSGGVWTDTAQMALDAAGSVTGGAIFDASSGQTLRFATVGGQNRILEAPIVAVASFSVDANRGLGAGTPAFIEIGVVPDPQPANFSNSRIPWSLGEVSLGTFSIASDITPLFTRETIAFTTQMATLVRAHVTSRSSWNGKVAFSFRGNNPADLTSTIRFFHPGLAGLASSLVTSQDLFFGGLVGGPFGGPVRVQRDGRYAMPAWSGQLVEDGDQPGLWVRPFDADPEDPTDEYRPRPGEGSIDDEVPDL